MLEHSVDGMEEFPHDSHERLHGFFTIRDELLVEGFDLWLVL